MQSPFSIRKKKSKIEQTQTPFGGDVFFNPKSSVLRLRRRPKFLTINWKALWDTPHAKFLTTGVVLIIIFSGSLISFKSSASVATFTPESCLGGWEATANATGLPSLPKDADAIDFHEDNSARLRGSSDIYCGDFRGEVPKDTSAKSFAVSFRISIDDGSVEHKKSEVIETEIEVKNTDHVDTVENIEKDEESSGGGNIETFDEQQEEPTLEIIEATTEPTDTVEQEVEVETQTEPEPQPEPEVQSESPEQTVFKKIFGKKVFAQVETVSEPQVVSELEPEPSDVPEPQPEPEATEAEDSEIDPVENPAPEVSDTDSNDNETNETSEDKESNSSDNSDDEANEAAESPVPADAILIATYTLDGEKWETFGYIRMNSWEDSDFPIELTDWDDLASLQVKLEPVPSFDRTPVVFLDAIVVEVEYDDSVENALSQPDFAHDTILSDSTVDDIRVIKILRDGVPMIWYTKLPPPPELVEVVPGNEPLLPGEVAPEDNIEMIEVPDQEVDDILPEILPVVEETTEIEVPSSVEVVTPTESEVVPETTVNDTVSWNQKIRSIFSLQKVLAQDGGGESGGDNGGDSGGSDTGSSGDSSTSTENSNSSDAPSTSSDTTGEAKTSSVDSETTEDPNQESDQTTETGGDESTTEESAEDFFKDIIIPGEGVIIVDDLVNEIVPHGTDYFEETADPLVTTTEEIVPGVVPIVYTEEQIQDEIMKGLEWNLVAMGDTIDISTPIDISGGKIFWLSRDKTALNEYNTNSGGISSQTVSSQGETEVKYTEPNGDISEITIDPVDLQITTPIEEETGIQNRTVPDFDGPKDSDTKSEILIPEESIKKDEEDLVKSDTSI